ncbi:MAG TPA: hypothetical protein GX505_05015 [Clostridiales bacterium]|nr:hypothetical protein [Clostridiales bacterium]
MEDKFSCSGCSRGCTIKITEEDGKIYIEGNKCIGGEQQIRLNRPELAERQLLKAEDKRSKKGFFSKLFSR